ncbi:GtrA family protein [Thalassospira lucentensis]|uniref:GtrA family protein n=1 Tax=Thalassospira lucentensis TaxID=168935 RepID=UPI00142E8B16|nr:GtrA family protein [Thalassospira lucentensis]NIZ03649.1 GtrA family protein [Thalassospira lucentensis]
MITKPLLEKGFRFVLVGTIGFVCDAGLLWLTTHQAGLDPYSGRLISFSFALFLTWLLNANFTFKSPNSKRSKSRFAGYVAVQLSSFSLNYGIYSGLVGLGLVLPIFALVIASLIAMFYSFTAMNMWVFKEKTHKKRAQKGPFF